MATYNFLDKTGLGLVWAKIKALVPTKTSDLQNDSGFITASNVPEEIFTINVATEYDETTESYVYTKDKTDSEIAAAYEAGKQLIVVDQMLSFSRGPIFRLYNIYAYNGYLSYATFVNDCQELIFINNNGIEYIDCLFNLHTYQSGIVEDYNHAWNGLWQAFTNGRAYIVNPQGSDRPPIIPSINMDWENFVSANISFINDQGDIVRLNGRSETSDGTDNIVMNAAVLKNPLVVNITYDSQTETYSANNDFYAIKYAGSDVVCIYQDENYQNKYYYYDHTYSEQAPNNQTKGCIVFSSLGSVTQNNGVLQANSDCFIISQINASGEPTVVTRTTFSQPIDNNVQSDWSEDDNTDDAYILNRPAIRAGDGENSIVEGQIEDETNVTTYTLLISGPAKATTFSYTTEDELPSASNIIGTIAYIEAAVQNSNKWQRIVEIDTSNNTITLMNQVSGTAAISNEELIIYHLSYSNIAYGALAHATGQNTVAAGNYSRSEGSGNLASGAGSHAEGSKTTSSGTNSHSEGTYTIASGSAAHAEGINTIANHKSQHVIGEYNIEDPSTASNLLRGNYVQIVGNGTSSARSNAYTLDWSGNGVYAGKVTVGAGPTNNMDVATKQYVDNAIPAVPDEVMWITITATTENDVTTYSADKTFAEISAHLTAGNTAICKDSYGNVWYLDYYNADAIKFRRVQCYGEGSQIFGDTYSISSNNTVDYSSFSSVDGVAKSRTEDGIQYVIKNEDENNFGMAVYAGNGAWPASVYLSGSKSGNEAYGDVEINAADGISFYADHIGTGYNSNWTPTDNTDFTTKAYVDAAIPTVPDDLGDLTDTAISAPSNGQILKYNSTTSKWVNADESKEVMVVYPTNVDGQGIYTFNKTFSEIYSHLNNGGIAILLYISSSTNIYEVSNWDSSYIYFTNSFIYSVDGEEEYEREVYFNESGFYIYSNNTGEYLGNTNGRISSGANLNGNFTAFPEFYAPTNAGTSGYVLTSNGSGAPTWQQAPAGVTVTLNGSTTTTPSFYAPTTSGNSGFYLKSNGANNAPTWDVFYPEAMVVNISGSSTYTSDKTFNQIHDFLDDDDGTIVCMKGAYAYHLAVCSSTNIAFERTYIDEDDDDYYAITERISINSNNVINVYTVANIQIPLPATSTPSQDGTGTAGTSTMYARANHVHPKITQTISISSNVITLTGSDGSTSSITLPVYDGTVATGSTGATGGTS